jgi:hypothetical protein
VVSAEQQVGHLEVAGPPLGRNTRKVCVRAARDIAIRVGVENVFPAMAEILELRKQAADVYERGLVQLIVEAAAEPVARAVV